MAVDHTAVSSEARDFSAGALASLVDAARAGDAAAWESIYRLAYPGLLSYAARRLGADDAREAVSETMARAVASIDRFEWRGVSFTGWLFGILRHVVADAQRAHCRDARRRDRLSQLRPVAPTTPAEHVATTQDAHAVRAALRQLSPADQELLELRYTGGLSAEDIASVLGKRVGAVRVAQSRALNRLRQRLEEDGWNA